MCGRKRLTNLRIPVTGAPNIGTIDPNNFKLDRATSQYNIPQVFQFTYVYQLPFGRGKHFGTKMNPVLDAIVGGWQTTGIWRFDDGQPLQVSLAGTNHPLPGYGQVPDMVGTPHRNSKSQWFVPGRVLCRSGRIPGACRMDDRNCAENPAVDEPARHGEHEPVALQGIFPEQASRRRAPRIPYGMVQRLQSPAIRRAQYASVGNAQFGEITSQANSPREVQMALKLYF